MASVSTLEQIAKEILQIEFNETKEGAEWFVCEGFYQIENGGTEIKDNEHEWHIKTLDDYYEFLCSLK